MTAHAPHPSVPRVCHECAPLRKVGTLAHWTFSALLLNTLFIYIYIYIKYLAVSWHTGTCQCASVPRFSQVSHFDWHTLTTTLATVSVHS